MTDTIDILVPVYGAAAYIERCAVSLMEQTYKAIAFYFLDDASPDNSMAILQDVVARYPHREVHLLSHEHNQGLAASRLDLINASHSPYLLQVDADDYLEHNAVECLMKKVADTGAEVVGMDCWFAWEGQKKAYRATWSESPILYTQILLSAQSLANVCRHLIKRSLYRQTGILPTPGLNNGEDYLVLPQLTRQATRIAYVESPLYYYWQANAQSYTHQLNRANIDSLVAVCQSLHRVFSDDTAYASALNEGMWRKRIDLMMRMPRALYPLAMHIPADGPVPYAALRLDCRIAGWLIAHHYGRLLSAYSTCYSTMFNLLQKLKGR